MPSSPDEQAARGGVRSAVLVARCGHDSYSGEAVEQFASDTACAGVSGGTLLAR